jgi:hypothetical protein
VGGTVSDDWHPVGGPADVSDSWDFDPDEDLPDTTYRGIRRAGGRSRLARLITAALVVGVLVSVAITVMRATRSPVRVLWAGGTGEPSAVVPEPLTASEPPVPTPTGTPSPSATASLKATPRAFAPIVVEAEAKPPSVMRRNADVETLTGASGGRAVVLVEPSSRIDIRNVTIPRAGRYRIAIDYASASGGTIQISIGASTVTVAVPASAQCCRSAAATVAVPAGRQRVTITRVSGSLAIDRVVIASPST